VSHGPDDNDPGVSSPGAPGGCTGGRRGVGSPR
jgi:hypothetical protein